MSTNLELSGGGGGGGCAAWGGPELKNGYPVIELTRSCSIFDWPIDQVSYPAHYSDPISRPIYAKVVAWVAIAVFSLLSLGFYSLYAYQAHTDRWLIQELHSRVESKDLAKIRELFKSYPQLKTRHLMYALSSPKSSIPGAKNILSYLIQGNTAQNKVILDELLNQGFELNAPAWIDFKPMGILSLSERLQSDPATIQYIKEVCPWIYSSDS